MKYKIVFFACFLLSTLGLNPIFAQQEPPKTIEEESSEVFLEEYTDEFQETFFEALKQKGIQNYDRASNLLLECRLLRPDDSAVDHELAKVNLLDKKFVPAEQYAIEALISEPENFWYLNTLNTIVEQQGSTLQMKKESIPFDHPSLQENLAQIYFQSKRYSAALDVVKGLKKSKRRDEMLHKITDSLNSIKTISSEQSEVKNESPASPENLNPVETAKAEIKALISSTDYEKVYELANEALESYPLQPYFYYALGLALNKKGNHSQAVETLETGLDYLFDDQELSNRFYEEIATAYKALGEGSKANEYLAKIKTGS